MLKLEKIKEIISGVVYGSIDQRISQRDKLIYGFVGLIIAVAVQVAFAYWLIPESRPHIPPVQFTLAGRLIPNKALLNIIAFPFQLLGIYSLIYIVQGATKYPFGKDSFWHLETEKYVPFFIRARTFMWLPYVVVFIISKSFEMYMNYKTKLDPISSIFWFIVAIIWIILVFILARWLKAFLEKFESTILSIEYLLPDELELKNYKRSIKREVFNSKEIAVILLLILLIQLTNVLNYDATWKGGGGSGYTFPITAIWSSFTLSITHGLVFIMFGSVVYVYSRIGFALKILKNQRLNIFLFHPDGRAGLGKVGDFIYSFLAKFLLIISIFTFISFLVSSIPDSILASLKIAPNPIFQKQVLGNTIISDLFALIFFYPLFGMRSIIKRKKEEERGLLLERIKQKEEVYLNRNLKSEEFQEIESNFNLIKHIDAVPEWGIDTRQWFPLLGRFLLTFNGVALQLTINYLKIY